MDPFELEPLPSQPQTIKQGGSRRWIHPVNTKGRYQSRRNVVAAVLLAFFYALPWLRLNDAPFLKLSFLSSSFVMLGRPILIYEFYHFVLFFFLLLLSLALASIAFGRVWCGWACPQTIFIEHILRRIETFIEGPAAKRLAQANSPLTLKRLTQKVLKQLCFVLVSFSFAFTLVALFTGTELLLVDHSRKAWLMTGLLTALAWFDGAYWREQFCHLVCPYGRFQGIAEDLATRTIGYDAGRGEPRRRGKHRDGAGDCIDCGLCVRVCPSGIDIRQGADQLECVACARCIDACDGVMTAVHKPKGLIRYDAGAVFHKAKAPSFWRPRLIVVAIAWLSVAVVGTVLFWQRDAFIIKTLSAARAAPYVLSEGKLKNILTLKVANQLLEPELFVVSIIPKSKEVVMSLKTPPQIGPILPGQEMSQPLLIEADPNAAGQEYDIVVIGQNSRKQKVISRRLLGPN